MQLNLGLTVNADDTVTGQLLLTAEKTLLKQRNPDLATAFADLRQNLPALPAGDDESPYQNDRFYGVQIAYRNKPVSQFTSDSLKLIRDGDLYRFSLPLDPKKYGGKVAEQDPRNQQLFLAAMSFEISVTFPGRVLDSNGTVNGRSVSWKVTANQTKPAELRAVAEAPPPPSPSSPSVATPATATSGGSFPWLLVIGGVLILLLVVVVVLLLRRPRGPVAAAPAAPNPAPVPPADHSV